MAVRYMGSKSDWILAFVIASFAHKSPHLFSTQFSYHPATQSDSLAVLGNNIDVTVKVNYQSLFLVGFGWILAFVPRIL